MAGLIVKQVLDGVCRVVGNHGKSMTALRLGRRSMLAILDSSFACPYGRDLDVTVFPVGFLLDRVDRFLVMLVTYNPVRLFLCQQAPAQRPHCGRIGASAPLVTVSVDQSL